MLVNTFILFLCPSPLFLDLSDMKMMLTFRHEHRDDAFTEDSSIYSPSLKFFLWEHSSKRQHQSTSQSWYWTSPYIPSFLDLFYHLVHTHTSSIDLAKIVAPQRSIMVNKCKKNMPINIVKYIHDEPTMFIKIILYGW